MLVSIPPKALTRLRAAFATVQHADQLFRAQIATVADMLDLDADDPTLQLNLERGTFVLPDPPEAAEESPNGAVAVLD